MKSARPSPHACVLALVLAAAGLLATAAHAGPVNDTGIDVCRDLSSGADTAVTPSTTCTPAQGTQDARFGRDAAAVKGALPKVGASAGTVNGNPNGFDYTKISNSGAPLPAGAALGTGANDWACTYDNNTGLMWEVKTNGAPASELRHMNHTYSWYFSANTYGGPGTAAGGACLTAGRCDTEKFAQDVNTAGLCGHTDWRVPTQPELANLVDRGRSHPSIDPTYFPNTLASLFWSASPFAGNSGGARGVGFGYGDDYWSGRGRAVQLRLVRAGQ